MQSAAHVGQRIRAGEAFAFLVGWSGGGIYPSDPQHECLHRNEEVYQLAEAPPNQFALAVTTVDGRILELGDSQQRSCVQSCCKPLLYGLALLEHGADEVSQHVGKEPSGSKFNDFKFDKDGLPFNPLINAGAIMSSSMIQAHQTPDKRFQHIMQVWDRMVGAGEAFFDNSTYLGVSRHRRHRPCDGASSCLPAP